MFTDCKILGVVLKYTLKFCMYIHTRRLFSIRVYYFRTSAPTCMCCTLHEGAPPVFCKNICENFALHTGLVLVNGTGDGSQIRVLNESHKNKKTKGTNVSGS